MTTLWEILRKHGLPLDRTQWICNEALLAGLVPVGWQPIETAPTDGTDFDGWGYYIPDSAEMPMEPQFGRHTECFWGDRDSHYVQRSKQPHMGATGWCSEGHDGWSWAMVLTHWMPVPSGPRASEPPGGENG